MSRQRWNEVWDTDPNGYEVDPGRVSELLGFTQRYSRVSYRTPVWRDEPDGPPERDYDPPTDWGL